MPDEVYILRRYTEDEPHWVNVAVLRSPDDVPILWAHPDDGWIQVHPNKAKSTYGSDLSVYHLPETDEALALDKFPITTAVHRPTSDPGPTVYHITCAALQCPATFPLGPVPLGWLGVGHSGPGDGLKFYCPIHHSQTDVA